MSNMNASILYQVLGADEYDGGVSGIGATASFSVEQMAKAMAELLKLYNIDDLSKLNKGALDMDKEQILNFISNCLDVAKEEGKVSIAFF